MVHPAPARPTRWRSMSTSTPLLLELGASVPWRGLYVLEADLPTFAERARAFAAGRVE